jgi:hypothetical protein
MIPHWIFLLIVCGTVGFTCVVTLVALVLVYIMYLRMTSPPDEHYLSLAQLSDGEQDDEEEEDDDDAEGIIIIEDDQQQEQESTV